MFHFTKMYFSRDFHSISKPKYERPDVVVRLVLKPIHTNILKITSSYGQRTLVANNLYEYPEEEARELIKVRTEELMDCDDPRCDIIIIEEI